METGVKGKQTSCTKMSFVYIYAKLLKHFQLVSLKSGQDTSDEIEQAMTMLRVTVDFFFIVVTVILIVTLPESALVIVPLFCKCLTNINADI
jgi:hypothetical protein